MSKPTRVKSHYRGRWLSWLSCLLLTGCAWWRPEQVDDPLLVPLQQADAAWNARGSVGLTPAADALAALLAAAPGDNRVLWRTARLYWLRGYLTDLPDDARNDWESGREYAYACMTTDPDVMAGFKQSGWLVTPAALMTTTPEQRPCLLWGAANGIALVEHRGPGATLDAEAACAMTNRAAAIVGASEPGLLDWELGGCAWWLGNDGEAAKRRWTSAAESGNGLYLLALHNHLPGDSIPVPTSEFYSLENARAAALLRQQQ